MLFKEFKERGGLGTEVLSSFLALQSNTEQLLIWCISKCFPRFDVLPSFASTTFWQIEHLALLVSTWAKWSHTLDLLGIMTVLIRRYASLKLTKFDSDGQVNQSTSSRMSRAPKMWQPITSDLAFWTTNTTWLLAHRRSIYPETVERDITIGWLEINLIEYRNEAPENY